MRGFVIRLTALLIMVLALSERAEGQFFLTGEAPSGVKWSVIRSDNYKLIYPKEFDSLAQRYMNLLEHYRPYVMAGAMVDTSASRMPRPIPVVLHPYTVQSNGMVTWAPKRVELYTTPPANNGYAQSWDEQLVLHESRHVGQMTAFTQGVFKPLNWILGEQITGFGCGVYGSKWLFEGDAVTAETSLTSSGRGRSASFLEYYRACAIRGDYRDWFKWRYGSNINYTPNIYPLGYMMVTAGRAFSGKYNYTGELLDYYVDHFYNPNVKNAGHKKLTGYKMRDLVRESFIYHAKWWEQDYKKRGEFTKPEEFQIEKSRYYTSYSRVLEVGKDTIIAVKGSYDSPTNLVMLSTNEEFLKENPKGEKHLRPFSSSTGYPAFAKGKIYYTESVGDIRWGLVAYNDLFTYDIKSERITRHTRGKSYNNPSLSPTSDSISVVEYPFGEGSNLVILDAHNVNNILASIPAPYGGQLTESVWMGGRIYALAITDRGIGLFSIDVSDLQSLDNKADDTTLWRCHIKEQRSNIGSLGSYKDMLYFKSDADGVNNIYSFDPVKEELKPLTNAEFAASNPHISNGRLYYTNLDIKGNYPVYTPVKKLAREGAPYLKEGNIENRYEYPIAEMLQKQAKEYFGKNNLLPDSLLFINHYNSKPYRKGTHLFRPHSWAPVYYNVDRLMQMSFDKLYDAVALGATLYSQSTLGTAVGMVGYSYRKGFHAAHASFEYSGWYPIFKVEAHYNAESRMQYKVVDAGTIFLNEKEMDKPLFEIIARCSVPLYFNSRGWQRGFVPQVLWKYDNHQFYSYQKKRYKSRHQLSYQLRYYQMRPVATAAIFPRWGFNLSVSGAISPGGEENFGSLAALNTYAYFPGFDIKQGLKLGFAYQRQFTDDKVYYLDNLVGMPRGCKDYYGSQYFKVSADYAIPINFKGLDLGFLGYYKRLQVIPFAEYARLKGKRETMNLTSFGSDLLIDGFLFKIGVPLSLGVRYAHTNDPRSRNHVSLLFSTTMF